MLELILSAVAISLGFPIFALVGGFAAFGFLAVLSVLAWTAAAVTALTLVRACVLVLACCLPPCMLRRPLSSNTPATLCAAFGRSP